MFKFIKNDPLYIYFGICILSIIIGAILWGLNSKKENIALTLGKIFVYAPLFITFCLIVLSYTL